MTLHPSHKDLHAILDLPIHRITLSDYNGLTFPLDIICLGQKIFGREEDSRGEQLNK